MRHAVLPVAALSLLMLPMSAPVPAMQTAGATGPGVTCRAPHDARAREYRLIRTGGVWQLEMRETATEGRWVALPLPGATPAFGDGTVSLSYRSAYGGRTVTLKVSPAAASLDVYANYELEVNVDPDLNPRIDRLNTDGPLTGLTCRVTAR